VAASDHLRAGYSCHNCVCVNNVHLGFITITNLFHRCLSMCGLGRFAFRDGDPDDAGQVDIGRKIVETERSAVLMSGHTGSAHELGDVEAGRRSPPSLTSSTAADLAEQRKRRFAAMRRDATHERATDGDVLLMGQHDEPPAASKHRAFTRK